ncbi:MAG: hypothetical protein IPH16_16135 [Haliscomenobacter sp.]|nr:hypothetical protein [Haliscomenobacter sp.]
MRISSPPWSTPKVKAAPDRPTAPSAGKSYRRNRYWKESWISAATATASPTLSAWGLQAMERYWRTALISAEA